MNDMGLARSRRSWQGMLYRCYDPSNKRWHRYGGRGIRTSQRWLMFSCFLADMGFRPEGHSLERVNNDGNYELGNCKWATPKEQMNNTRRNVWVEHSGKRLTIAQWARETGLPTVTIRARLRRGWSIEQVFTPDRSKTYKRPQPARIRNICVVPDCNAPTRAYHGQLCKRHTEAQRYGRKLVAECLPPGAKIDPAKVRYIRSDEAKQRNKQDLARELGISVATINDIRRGHTWRMEA